MLGSKMGDHETPTFRMRVKMKPNVIIPTDAQKHFSSELAFARLKSSYKIPFRIVPASDHRKPGHSKYPPQRANTTPPSIKTRPMIDALETCRPEKRPIARFTSGVAMITMIVGPTPQFLMPSNKQSVANGRTSAMRKVYLSTLRITPRSPIAAMRPITRPRQTMSCGVLNSFKTLTKGRADPAVSQIPNTPRRPRVVFFSRTGAFFLVLIFNYPSYLFRRNFSTKYADTSRSIKLGRSLYEKPRAFRGAGGNLIFYLILISGGSFLASATANVAAANAI